MPTKEEMASWKEWAWVRATASGRVCLTPCLLAHASLTADAVGAAVAAIYDGHGEAEDVVMDLGAVQHGHTPYPFDPPLYLRKGLYVKKGVNVKSVLVHFLPLQEGH